MSIESEINRIKTNISNAYTTLENKGATLPSTQDSSNLANCVGTVPTGITPTGTIQISDNGTVDVTNYASAEVSVSGGGGSTDFSEYFYNKVFGGSSNYYAMWAILKIPDNFLTISSGTTDISYAFQNLKFLNTAPYFDTSTITNMQYMFNGCNSLVNVPVYDTSHLSTSGYPMQYMFSSTKLSDQSLDNILQMCINAPTNMGGRNLARVGLTSSAYPASKIQSLPHYQQFLAANWTIGY